MRDDEGALTQWQQRQQPQVVQGQGQVGSARAEEERDGGPEVVVAELTGSRDKRPPADIRTCSYMLASPARTSQAGGTDTDTPGRTYHTVNCSRLNWRI